MFILTLILQHQNLSKCVEAAGAKCQLISSPDSVAMETLVAREAVVLAWEDLPTTPTQQKYWRDGIKKLLEKCVEFYVLICTC